MFSHDLPINEALKRRSWYSTRRRELSANACGNGARIGAAEAIGGHEDGPCIGVIEDIRDVQSGVRGGARGMVILSDLRTECNGLAPFVRLGPLRTLKSTKYQHQTQRRQC